MRYRHFECPKCQGTNLFEKHVVKFPLKCQDESCAAPISQNDELQPKRFQGEKSHVQIIGAAVENAEYNPGLGCVTKSKRDREEQAKRRGLVEIGNDFGSADKMHDHYSKSREEARKKSWEEM